MIQLLAELPCLTHLVGTETLERVVGELVTDVDQGVVGVDVVQAVGLGLARRLAHILAIPKQAVEVELVTVFTVGSQTGITGWMKKKGKCNLWSNKRKVVQCNGKMIKVFSYFS